MERLFGGLNLPAGRRFQLHGAGRTGAIGGNFDFHRTGLAGRKQLDLGVETERNRRNHIQPAPGLRLRLSRHQLHRLIRNNQRLAADFENLLDGKHRRVFRAANQCGIIHAERSWRAFFAQPVGLGQRRAGGQWLHRIQPSRLVRTQFHRVGDSIPGDRISHAQPADRNAGTHNGSMVHLQRFARHDFGLGNHRLHFQAQAGLQDAIELGAFFNDQRVCCR